MEKVSKTTKRCPRCERKMPIAAAKCPRCGLIFARLSKATNAAAKKAIRKREKNKVIYDAVLPKDVNKWKLFWMALLLGVFGGHNFYVGKYLKGALGLVSMVMIGVAAALPIAWWSDYYLGGLMTVLVIPAGFNVIFWVASVISILLNKFRVPISIDEEYVVDDKDGTK